MFLYGSLVCFAAFWVVGMAITTEVGRLKGTYSGNGCRPMLLPGTLNLPSMPSHIKATVFLKGKHADIASLECKELTPIG